MKIKSLTSRIMGVFTSRAVVIMLLMFSISCKKNEDLGLSSSAGSSSSTEQSERLRASVSDAIKVFANRNSGNRTGDFTDPAYNFTTYSTPSATVYQWSNPTTGTVFTLAESSGGAGGAGLGQLAYNNKSFDYNYVLTIKATGGDPAWDGFLAGRDLIGVVAIDIDGDISSGNFTLKNFAIFLVATNGGLGTYEFNDFNSTTITNTFAVGEIIDLSAVQGASLQNFATDGKVYLTTGGHIIVSSSDFTMDSDAKIMDVVTAAEFGLSGSIMFE